MISSLLSVSAVGIFHFPLSLRYYDRFLLLSHEEPVAFRIRTEEGGCYTFYTLGGYEIIPLKKLELNSCVLYVSKKVTAIMLN